MEITGFFKRVSRIRYGANSLGETETIGFEFCEHPDWDPFCNVLHCRANGELAQRIAEMAECDGGAPEGIFTLHVTFSIHRRREEDGRLHTYVIYNCLEMAETPKEVLDFYYKVF